MRLAFVEIKVREQSRENAALLQERLSGIAEVISCHMVSGAADFLIELVVVDLRSYERLLTEHARPDASACGRIFPCASSNVTALCQSANCREQAGTFNHSPCLLQLSFPVTARKARLALDFGAANGHG
jgi:DNA-binding Lrp family transcriptional regulator